MKQDNQSARALLAEAYHQRKCAEACEMIPDYNQASIHYTLSEQAEAAAWEQIKEAQYLYLKADYILKDALKAKERCVRQLLLEEWDCASIKASRARTKTRLSWEDVLDYTYIDPEA